MPTLIENCKEYFHTDSLYDILGVAKEARKQELKKGYHKRSLAYHPDRASHDDKELATKKFQVLSQVYSILSNDDLRTEYDETGCVGEEVSIDKDKDWEQYWRLLFPKVTIKDIEEFAEKYKGSDEEVEDLKKVYLSSEGNMDVLMDTMLCSNQEDEPRFTKILKDLIKKKELPDFKSFSKEDKKKRAARLKKAQQEAKEAEEEAKKLKLDSSEDSLMKAIAERQTSRAKQADDFFSHLEAKYGGTSGRNKGGKKTKK